MALNWVVNGLVTYVLVFTRMAGMVLFNPLLSRRNIPIQVKVALILGLTVLIAPTLGSYEITDTFRFLIVMTQEMAIGLACGLVFQFFYYMIFMAGDLIDIGFGLSMAKVFDPGSNIQMSMSGNLFQMVFVLYLFATDSHLLLIKIMASSYDVVGLGAATFSTEIGKVLIFLFTTAFSLAMRLALPFLAASFVLEAAMGILMKLIPQINVFSIHFQLKIFLGLLLLFLFAVPVNHFIGNYVDIMFANMQKMVEAFG